MLKEKEQKKTREQRISNATTTNIKIDVFYLFFFFLVIRIFQSKLCALLPIF